MKVLSGVYPHGTYDGDIVFDGEVVRVQEHPGRARPPGIVIIHQELALIPELSIAENIFLGNETASGGVINWDRTNRRGHRAAARVGLRREPGDPGRDIGVGQAAAGRDRQGAVQEGEAAHPRRADRGARTTRTPQHLLDLLKGLKGKGITSIMISHKLNEIEQIADSVTIIRDGRTIETLDVAAGRRRRGPDHQRDGRPRPRQPLPRRTSPHIGDGALRDPRLDRRPPDRPAAQGRRRRDLTRAPRRDRRHRRPDGRRPHRAGDERLRPLLRQHGRGPDCPERRGDPHRAPCTRRSTPASPTSPRTASCSASTSSTTSTAEHLGRARQGRARA